MRPPPPLSFPLFPLKALFQSKIEREESGKEWIKRDEPGRGGGGKESPISNELQELYPGIKLPAKIMFTPNTLKLINPQY